MNKKENFTLVMRNANLLLKFNIFSKENGQN